MNFFTLFKSFIKAIIDMLKWFSFLLIPIAILFIIIFIFFVYYYYKNKFIYRVKKKYSVKRVLFKYKDKKYVYEYPIKIKYKEPSFIKKIMVLFPKQLATDFINKNPNAFCEYGIHMVTGKQGAGKTITVVYLLRKWQQLYPNLQVYTNMAYKYENGELYHWKDLLLRNNGIYGIVNVIDEIHTWFSNKESKDLPPEILGEISQQRKQKKCIIGTAQVFSKIAKPLREQTHFVYIPYTILGCLTIVRRAEAEDYDPEKNKFKKYKGFFIFVHTKELRDAYDTYKRISRYSETEFAISDYYRPEDGTPTMSVVASADKKKKI